MIWIWYEGSISAHRISRTLVEIGALAWTRLPANANGNLYREYTQDLAPALGQWEKLEEHNHMLSNHIQTSGLCYWSSQISNLLSCICLGWALLFEISKGSGSKSPGWVHRFDCWTLRYQQSFESWLSALKSSGPELQFTQARPKSSQMNNAELRLL